jgi:hypothetical protein
MPRLKTRLYIVGKKSSKKVEEHSRKVIGEWDFRENGYIWRDLVGGQPTEGKRLSKNIMV